MADAKQVVLVRVRVKAHVHLAGQEHSAGAPARWFKGEIAEIDEETAKASPWAFEPVDPAVKQRWVNEKAAQEKAAVAAAQ